MGRAVPWGTHAGTGLLYALELGGFLKLVEYLLHPKPMHISATLTKELCTFETVSPP
jgi:hypothetical protein